MEFFQAGDRAINLDNIAHIRFWSNEERSGAEVSFVGDPPSEPGKVSYLLTLYGEDAERLRRYVANRSASADSGR